MPSPLLNSCSERVDVDNSWLLELANSKAVFLSVLHPSCREEFKWMEGLQIHVVSPIMLLKLGRSSWFWLSIEKVNRSYLTLQVSSDFFNNIFKQDYNIILIITTKPCFYCRSRYCQEKKYIDSSGFVDIFRINILNLTVSSLQITST